MDSWESRLQSGQQGLASWLRDDHQTPLGDRAQGIQRTHLPSSSSAGEMTECCLLLAPWKGPHVPAGCLPTGPGEKWCGLQAPVHTPGTEGTVHALG